MAGVVTDTTVLIDVLRGSAAGVNWLVAQPDPPTCSEITRVEIIRGLRSDERARAETLFTALDWVPISEQVSRLAGEFGQRYRRSHQGIAAADLVVAATAALANCEPATHNVKHFPMFPGLRVPY